MCIMLAWNLSLRKAVCCPAAIYYKLNNFDLTVSVFGIFSKLYSAMVSLHIKIDRFTFLKL